MIFGTTERDLNVANNVRALLVIELLALVYIGYAGRRERLNRTRLIGYAAGVAIWLVATVVFFADRERFLKAAHLTSAGLMFAFITCVVLINAFRQRAESDSLRNKYTLIAFTMVGVAAVVIPAGKLAGWDYWAIVVESALIVLFAAFWVLQTWDESRRASGHSR